MSVNRSDEVSLSDRYVLLLQEALTESRELRRQVATREEERRENDSKMERLLNRVDELCEKVARNDISPFYSSRRHIGFVTAQT